MSLFSKLGFYVLLPICAGILTSCRAEAPQPKTSSTQDLFAQVEAMEADEAALLFQQAKAAAEKDNILEAKSLIQQGLGRGAGTAGMNAAKAEIEAAEKRLDARKAAALTESDLEALGRATVMSSSSSTSSSSYSGSSSSNLRQSGVSELYEVNPGKLYNAKCNDGSLSSIDIEQGNSKPMICIYNQFTGNKCKHATDWSINTAAKFSCER